MAFAIVTGISNTVMTLGRRPTDWSSPDEALLIVTIASVALMIVFAILNRYGPVAHIRMRREPSLRALRALTLAEISLGFAVIAGVSVFGMPEPC